MPYFPDAVYATVFAARQRATAMARAGSVEERVAGERPQPEIGILGRLGRAFSWVSNQRPAAHQASRAELGELFEYHNPTLGVRELGRG